MKLTIMNNIEISVCGRKCRDTGSDKCPYLKGGGDSGSKCQLFNAELKPARTHGKLRCLRCLFEESKAKKKEEGDNA